MTANNTSFQFNIPQLTRYTVNQPRTVGTQVNYKFLVRCETQPMALKNKETIVALKIYIRTLFPLLWVESLSQSARIDLARTRGSVHGRKVLAKHLRIPVVFRHPDRHIVRGVARLIVGNDVARCRYQSPICCAPACQNAL